MLTKLEAKVMINIGAEHDESGREEGLPLDEQPNKMWDVCKRDRA